VTIGIVSEQMVAEKFYQDAIEPYPVREASVKTLLSEEKFSYYTSVSPLIDIYGPALQRATIDAIFVTEDTYKNALTINQQRQKKDMQPLTIKKIPLVMANDGKPITSARIRAGEIDRNGNVYVQLFKKQLVMPESLRAVLQEPLGAV